MSINRKIRGLTIDFGADTTGLMKGLSEVEYRLRKTSSLYKDINKLMKLDPRNVELISQKQGQLNKLIDQTKDKVKQLKKIESQMKMDGVAENSDELKALRREIIDNEQSLKQYEKQLKRVNSKLNINTSNLGQFGLKLKDEGARIQAVGEKIKGYGDQISNIGRKLTKSLTVPLAGIGTASIIASSKFESGLAGVAKTTNMSRSQLKKFGDEISRLSRTMPQSTEEMLKVAESAGQLGIADKDILSFTEAMLKMGQATNLSAEQASTSLARFANVMGTSAKEYSNMGSAIVELGNNFATTESEILELALRLSGTSKLVGITEANVFGLSTAMRSMNISAEAGGSAVSRVMQKINTSVISNSDELKKFATTAGMSADEFAKVWREKPEQALLSFLKGLDKVNNSGGDTITLLKDMEISSIREVDALSRLASNTDLVNKAFETSNRAYKENTALTKEAEIRNKTLASRFEMVKNQTKELGRQVGETLLPHIEKILEKAKEWIAKFKALGNEKKELIVKTGALIGVLGPLLTIFGGGIKLVGSLTGGIGGLLKGAGSLITTIAGKGGLIASLGGIGTTLATVGKAIGTFFTGPVGIGVGVATVAAIGAVKHFRKSSIEEVDLMADGVSEGVKKALGGFLELHEGAEKSLKLMMSGSQKITSEGMESIITNYDEMKTRIVGKLTEQKDKALKILQEGFSKHSKLSEEEQKKMLETVEVGYSERIKKSEEAEAKIKEILQKASDEKRALSEEEKNTINNYQNQMKEEGVRTLTETEEEYAIIRQRMKDNASKMSALQASEIVQMSLAQKDKVIQTAEEEYNEKIKLAEQIRVEGTAEAQKAADEIIKNAGAQKQQTIAEAKEQHQKVVESAKKQAEEHVNHVNWETGKVLNKWEIFKKDFSKVLSDIEKWGAETWSGIRLKTGEIWNSIGNSLSDKWQEISSESRKTWEKVKNDTSNAWNETKKISSNVWNGIKDAMTGAVSGAWSSITGWIEKIKNAFNFSWSLPKPRLPKIKITTAKGLFGIPYPKFDIKWNRMGGIFKQPTVLPTLAGLQGFAEPSTGGEAIMPLDKLPGIIANAMDMVKGGQPQTIVNYIMLDGKVIGKEVTNTVDSILGRKSMRERLVGGL